MLGFLDVTGNWDATLLFVLGGAVGVTVIAFRFVLRLPKPVDAEIILERLPERIRLAMIARSAEIEYPIEAIVEMALG